MVNIQSRVRKGVIGKHADYDYANASKPRKINGRKKYSSINPDTGVVLKRKRHPTLHKTKKSESKLGNVLLPVRGRKVSTKTKRAGFTKQ